MPMPTSTIHVEAQVSPEELLKAVEQLGPPDLDQLLARVLAARAHRKAPSIAADDGALLRAIGEGVPSEVRGRRDELNQRRRASVLTPEEHEELCRLGDRVEAIEARRAESLVRLAEMRGVTLPVLLDALGIQTLEYE